jgi:hypothetical protein
VPRFELEFLRVPARSGAPDGYRIKGKGLNAPELNQEPFVARIASMVSQPAELFLDEGEEHAGGVVDVWRGDAGTRGSFARQQSSGTRATILDLGKADLERTFLG